MLVLRKLFNQSGSPKTTMTFRLRLTLWYSALVMSIVIIFSGVVYIVLQRAMLNQVDQSLIEVVDEVDKDLTGFVFVTEEGNNIAFTPHINLNSLRTPGVFIQVWRAEQFDYPLSRTANLSQTNKPIDVSSLKGDVPAWSNVVIEGKSYRVYTRPIKNYDFTVAYIQSAASLETVNDASNQLMKIMLIGTGLALLLSVLLGDWFARRALRPVANITRTAEQIIAAEDLASRINYNGPQDELGYLITTLNAMISRLEKLFTAQQRFVADVSHELRTPLTAIQANLDLAERYGLQEHELAAIKSETSRMSRLVGDLLTLAQADLGYLPFVESDVELDTLILEIYNQALLLSKGKNRIELEEIDQVMVSGDSDRLKQLLLNLVMNAIKYTPEEGSITLSLRQTNEHAEIIVKDTGIGIPPEDLPHIFDRFYRVDKARARKAGGSGLGLAIAQWIADAHHGKLSVESTVGEGTCFALTIPRKDSQIEVVPVDEDKVSLLPKFRLKRPQQQPDKKSLETN